MVCRLSDAKTGRTFAWRLVVSATFPRIHLQTSCRKRTFEYVESRKTRASSNFSGRMEGVGITMVSTCALIVCLVNSACLPHWGDTMVWQLERLVRSDVGNRAEQESGAFSYHSSVRSCSVLASDKFASTVRQGRLVNWIAMIAS